MPTKDRLPLFTYCRLPGLGSLLSGQYYLVALHPPVIPSRLLFSLSYCSSLTTPLSGQSSQPASSVESLCHSSHLHFRTLNSHSLEQVADLYLCSE